jgi:hypothetical protein
LQGKGSFPEGENHFESEFRLTDLLKGYNIRVPESSLKEGRGESIHLADESGDVWGSLSVYHHLHCLVRYTNFSKISTSRSWRLKFSTQDSIRHHIHGRGCKSRDSNVDSDGFPVHLGR